jgi:hypothetical protein
MQTVGLLKNTKLGTRKEGRGEDVEEVNYAQVTLEIVLDNLASDELGFLAACQNKVVDIGLDTTWKPKSKDKDGQLTISESGTADADEPIVCSSFDTDCPNSEQCSGEQDDNPLSLVNRIKADEVEYIDNKVLGTPIKLTSIHHNRIYGLYCDTGEVIKLTFDDVNSNYVARNLSDILKPDNLIRKKADFAPIPGRPTKVAKVTGSTVGKIFTDAGDIDSSVINREYELVINSGVE